MIIDTDVLREKIETADDAVDFEKCPISKLTSLETRAVRRMNLIKDIEALQVELMGT